MRNILIGREIGEDVFRINAQLRAATVDAYNQTAHADVQAYTPWLSMFPLLPEKQLPPELLRQPTFVRGGLVEDQEYLCAARDFMLPRTVITQNGIFDQKHSDWVADTQVTDRQKAVYDAGRATLLAADTTLARLFFELIDFTVPLQGQRNRGFSSHAIRGAIFRTIPDEDNKYDVAIDLAHEMGHYGLMTLQSIDPIMTSDPTKLVYSSIRKHVRPVIQVYHAAVALAFMHTVVASMPDDPICQETGARRGSKYAGTFKKSVEISIELLQKECEFTDLGKQILNEMMELC